MFGQPIRNSMDVAILVALRRKYNIKKHGLPKSERNFITDFIENTET